MGGREARGSCASTSQNGLLLLPQSRIPSRKEGMDGQRGATSGGVKLGGGQGVSGGRPLDKKIHP